MKAVSYERYGEPERVMSLREVPIPQPHAGEVRIKVRATGLNSWDVDLVTGTTQGRLFGLTRPRWPILGCDVAGHVDAVGEGVTEFSEGDEVFGDLSGASWGGLAEFTCGPASLLARKPPNLSFVQAAATPQAGVLALQGLRHRSPLTSTDRVLLVGAGGGVGTFALQLAKQAGAFVAVVDRPAKLARLTELGADLAIDYTQEDVVKRSETYDLVLDMVGRRWPGRFRRILREGGRYVMVGGTTPHLFANLALMVLSRPTSRRAEFLLHQPNAADLLELGAAIVAGEIRPVIGETVSLSEAPEAIARLKAGEIWGKSVIEVYH